MMVLVTRVVFADNINACTFFAQFLGDPHLSISHVNYMLEQVFNFFIFYYHID